MRTKNKLSRKVSLCLCLIGALLISLAIEHRISSNPVPASVANLTPTEQTAIAQSTLVPTLMPSAAAPPTNTRSITTNPPTATTTASTPKPTLAAASPYLVIDEQRRDRFRVEGNQVLSASNLPNLDVSFNANDLLYVLQNTQTYFQTYLETNPDIQRTGILGTQGVTVADVRDTLDFMIATLQEDIANRRPIRLKDPAFLNANFRVIRWTAYNPNDSGQRLLRLTKYAVFNHPGSRTRTATYTVPLYQLNTDAESDRFYLNYTKQQVLSGIYEQGGREAGRVQPLAYLTRDSFEDALMQGTVLVNFTDGTSAYFNVDRNNGIAYIPGVSAYRQGRYWYFKPVDAIKGYGHESEAKISIKPGVTFAGDVLNIGLGRIVVLEYNTTGQPQLQLGIVADTGGAFLPNLHQLDLLAGVFRDRDQFYSATSQLPEYTKAYLLVRKRPTN